MPLVITTGRGERVLGFVMRPKLKLITGDVEKPVPSGVIIGRMTQPTRITPLPKPVCQIADERRVQPRRPIITHINRQPRLDTPGNRLLDKDAQNIHASKSYAAETVLSW